MGFKKNFEYGLRSYFRHLYAGEVTLPGQMPRELKETIFVKDSVNKIDRCSEACKMVVKIHDAQPALAREYTRTTRSGRMPRSGENRCKIWLSGYRDWLIGKIEPAPEIPTPEIPEIKMPNIKMPAVKIDTGFGIGKGTKAIIGLVMFAFLVLLFLVALGYSGMGGSVGRVAETEHGRRRK